MKKPLIFGIMLILFSISVSAAPCGGNVTCECEDTVVENTTLDYNIECNSLGFGYGLVIGASDIYLDCDGYNIEFLSTSVHETGIFVSDVSDVIIRNCIIKNFKRGSTISSSHRVNFYSNTLENLNYPTWGLFLEVGSNHLIWNNTFMYHGMNGFGDNGLDLNSNSSWNNSNIGNWWNDFTRNSGYPFVYNIDNDGVDYHPLNLIEDTDGDGIPDDLDNCRHDPNPGQEDEDDDGVGDVCDNCPLNPNSGQEDADGDTVGNVCDNCPTASNLWQGDFDSDGIGDWCDNCILTSNPDQSDTDEDGLGDACEGTGYQCRAFQSQVYDYGGR